MPNDNDMIRYGGALAQLFGLPQAQPTAARRVPVRLPTDNDAADKASRMVRSVDPRLAATTFRKAPAAPDKNSGMSLADLVAGKNKAQQPSVSTLDSVIANVGDLGGLGRLVYAGGNAAGNALGRYITGKPQDFENDFDNARNRKKDYLDAATEQHPYASWAGWLLGAAPTLAALPTAKIPESASLAARAGVRAAEGAGYSAAFGAADANKGGRIEGAKRAAAAGALLAPAVGAVADKAAPTLKALVDKWRTNGGANAAADVTVPPQAAADDIERVLSAPVPADAGPKYLPPKDLGPPHPADIDAAPPPPSGLASGRGMDEREAAKARNKFWEEKRLATDPEYAGPERRVSAEVTPTSAPPAAPSMFRETSREPDGTVFLEYRPKGSDAPIPIKMGIDNGVAEIAIDQFSSAANRLGPAKVREAMMALKDMYPEIETFAGFRRSGAGKGRVQEITPPAPKAPVAEAPLVQDNAPPPLPPMADTAAGAPDTLSFPKGDVDVDLRSTDGLKALMAERGIDPEMISRDPVTPTGEPANPLGSAGNDANALRDTPEGQIGSRDPAAMGLNPDQAEAMKLGADYGGIAPEYRSRADTEAAGDALGYTPGNVPPVGDLSAQISAGEKVTTQTVDDIFKAVKETGTDSQETVDALDKFVETFGPHSQNVGETGRALNILRKDKYNAKGEVVNDPDAAKIVRENLADPVTRDAALAAIKAAKGNPKALAQVANKLKTKTASDFVSRTYYATWLSDPASQSRNIVGNTEKLLSDMGINGITAIGGLPFKLSGTSNRVFGREVAGSAYGAIRGALSGLANLKTAYTRGAPLDQAGREGSVGVGGKVSNILEFGPRGMAAGDEFFRSVAFMSDMYRRATREAIIDAGEEGGVAFKKLFPDINDRVANPSQETIKASVDYAKEARFQNEPGFVGKGIERMLAPSKDSQLPTRALQTTVRLGVLPFVRTPANILREAARMSPAGIMSSRNWRDWRAGGPAAQAATARVAFGTGVAATVWSMVGSDSMTGAGPSDYKKLAALKDTGWTPNSFKIGNKYIPYEGLGPLSAMLSGVATSAERYKAGEIDGKGFGDKMASATLGIADAAIHNGWMSGLADVFDALGKTSDDERSKAIGDTILSQATSPLMPGLARAINQSWFDPYSRETKGNNNPGVDGMLDRAGNRIKTVWPGLSDDLPVKKDTLGDPVLNRRGGGGLGAFVSPSVAMPIKDDPATVEIGRLERGIGKKTLVPPAPTSIIIKGLGNVRLNGEQYQEFQAMMGASIMADMKQLMADPSWKSLDDNSRRALVSNAVTDGRKLAKEQFLAALPTSEGSPDGKPKVDGGNTPNVVSGGNVPDGGNAAPIDTANTFIGIPTSIRRTVKGNEAVGGAAHSDHLNGDAVDFLPPEGVSMKQLEAAARKFFPGMYVLNEGDHVHVRIPGLNGPLFGKKGTAK